MAKKDSKRKTVERSPLDVECDAINAFSRLNAMASLMECTAHSSLDFEASDLFAIGDLVRRETKRAKTAFYELHGMASRKEATNA